MIIPAERGWYWQYDPKGDPESMSRVIAWQEKGPHLAPMVENGDNFAHVALTVGPEGEIDGRLIFVTSPEGFVK